MLFLKMVRMLGKQREAGGGGGGNLMLNQLLFIGINLLHTSAGRIAPGMPFVVLCSLSDPRK
jgi:hypothetical protein